MDLTLIPLVLRKRTGSEIIYPKTTYMIEAGKLMKELADQNTELGKQVRDALSKGENAPLNYNDPLTSSSDYFKPFDDSDIKESPWYTDGFDSDHRFVNDISGDDLLNARGEDADATQLTENKSETNSEETPTSYIEKYGADGGRYGDMKDEGWGWNSEPPTEKHHMPANSTTEFSTEDGPCIVMDLEDHNKTASYGKSTEAQEYRAKQKELIEEGKFREAFQMDVDDLREKFGDKYDESIKMAEAYIDKLEQEGKI